MSATGTRTHNEGKRMQGIFIRKKGRYYFCAGKRAGTHGKESKIPTQDLHSTCVGMLAMHKEVGSVPRPGWPRTWFVVNALHYYNICKIFAKYAGSIYIQNV